MQRREFLKRAGYVVVSASVVPFLGCGDDDDTSSSGSNDSPDTSPNSEVFPQGVASGDPQPNAVVLWTRAVPTQGANASSVALQLQVSETEDFAALVVDQALEARIQDDYTLRIYVDTLTPNRWYYYRFVAGSDYSRVGRTRTAPEADADVEPRFAWASCQDYQANFYTAYRLLLDNDLKAAEADQLHFILFVGDFIYETRSADFMQALTDELQPTQLQTQDGSPRIVPEFPSGSAQYAQTVEDYRQLYKQYLTDPNLQEARARWPFIQVWDDHEFTDDCWQTQANYTRENSTDEPSQKRRVAASQAWFEYVPAALSDAQPGGDGQQPAHDFTPVEVEDAPYTETVEVTEPNNQQALSAITIYRNLRWGKHLEIVITDNRSYRSDHAIAEESTVGNPLIFDPRVALPKEAVNTLDAGRTANAGHPPDSVQDIPNTRKNSDPGTILGATQKAWWKSTLAASNATFKVWANSVPLLRLLVERSAAPILTYDRLLTSDAWDGYNTERKELMAYLKEQDIKNVVSLSGDHHAHYAGLVYDDYDAEVPTPVMTDFATAGIASNSQWSLVAAALSGAAQSFGSLADLLVPVQQIITYDATALGGSTKAVVNLNTLLLYGSQAAIKAAQTNDIAQAQAARDPKVNPHLRYADAHAFGYGLVQVTGTALTTQLVSIQRTFSETDPANTTPQARGTATFRVPNAKDFSELTAIQPEFTGPKPFPLDPA
jgi:alkaline phosphatase D